MRHSSPRRQLFIVVAGEIEVSTSTGQPRIFKSGDLLMGEDITGKDTGPRSQRRSFGCYSRFSIGPPAQ